MCIGNGKQFIVNDNASLDVSLVLQPSDIVECQYYAVFIPTSSTLHLLEATKGYVNNVIARD